MDIYLKVLGYAIVVLGFVIVIAAKPIIKKFDLASKQKVNIEGVAEEKINELKEAKALAMVKVIGAIVFLPGMIIILLVF